MKFSTSVALPTLDLSNVMAQVKADPRYADWPKERLAQAEVEYRQFLALCKAYPQAPLSPTVDGDVVWHYHILNTSQYIADCNSYLGEYLHHQPGKVSKTDEQASLVLYEKHFGRTSLTTICGRVATCGRIATCGRTPARRQASEVQAAMAF